MHAWIVQDVARGRQTRRRNFPAPPASAATAAAARRRWQWRWRPAGGAKRLPRTSLSSLFPHLHGHPSFLHFFSISLPLANPWYWWLDLSSGMPDPCAHGLWCPHEVWAVGLWAQGCAGSGRSWPELRYRRAGRRRSSPDAGGSGLATTGSTAPARDTVRRLWPGAAARRYPCSKR